MEFEFPKLNVEMLSNIINWAWADNNRLNAFMEKNFPGWGSWDQGHWAEEVRNGVCQTSFCMAGQTVVQAGFKLDYQFDGWDREIWDDESDQYVPADENAKRTFTASYCYPARKNGLTKEGEQRYRRTGESTSISNAAREILGLTQAEADLFFDGGNSIERVVRLAKTFAAVRGEVLNLVDGVEGESYTNLRDSGIRSWRMNGQEMAAYEEFFAGLAQKVDA